MWKANTACIQRKIDESALKKERFTISELQERLRGKMYLIQEAWNMLYIETNGEVSVILKPNKKGQLLQKILIWSPNMKDCHMILIVDGK